MLPGAETKLLAPYFLTQLSIYFHSKQYLFTPLNEAFKVNTEQRTGTIFSFVNCINLSFNAF